VSIGSLISAKPLHYDLIFDPGLALGCAVLIPNYDQLITISLDLYVDSKKPFLPQFK